MEDQAGWRQETFPFALLGENVTGPGRGRGGRLLLTLKDTIYSGF